MSYNQKIRRAQYIYWAVEHGSDNLVINLIDQLLNFSSDEDKRRLTENLEGVTSV